MSVVAIIILLLVIIIILSLIIALLVCGFIYGIIDLEERIEELEKETSSCE